MSQIMTVLHRKQENRLVRYFQDTRAEIAKVTWPTREEGPAPVRIVVLIVTIVSTIVLFGDRLVL